MAGMHGDTEADREGALIIMAKMTKLQRDWLRLTNKANYVSRFEELFGDRKYPLRFFCPVCDMKKVVKKKDGSFFCLFCKTPVNRKAME